MAREIKILIPDDIGNETVDIKVFVSGKEMLRYKLEMFVYHENEVNISRADFVKQEIDAYSKDYTLIDVGLDDDHHIPVLFRSFEKGVK